MTSPGVAAAQPTPRPAILVVEDDTLIAMLIEEMFASLGCEVVGPAATVARALALTRRGLAAAPVPIR